MRLPTSLVLPLLVGAVQAASDTAKVYIFQKPEYPTSSTIPTLTPEEARLVIAQRLDVSRYHSLRDASKDGLAHIDAFGGPQTQLFANDGQDKRSQLVVVIDNATPELAGQYQSQWAPIQPAFEISNPPSRTANKQLIRDMIKQNPLMEINHDCKPTDYTNPFNELCWPGKSRILHFHAGLIETRSSQIQKFTSDILAYVKSEAMEVMIILMPESSRRSSNQYGLYDMPARSHSARSAQFEEPIEEFDTSSINESNVFSLADEKKKTDATVGYPACYSTNDTCQSKTNNCSGHGQCRRKYKSEDPDDSCYTCECVPSINITEAADGTELARRTYWGGAACQKQDVSSPFWLLVGITVVLVGLTSAGVGMLFSIGEEKLPSVIGAGVSGPKAR